MPCRSSEKNNSNHADQDKKSLFGFAFLHFMNDTHSTAIPTIIPMLVSSISISMSQAGLLNAIFGFVNIFGQPVSGYFADRQRRPWFAVWGPMLSVAGACILPLAPNYACALLLASCMSTGTAIFHPQGTGRTGAASGGRDLAFFISLFAASGSFGSSIGPLYVVFMISLLGKSFFPIMILPIFLICLLIWKNLVPSAQTVRVSEKQADISDFFSNIRALFGKIGGIVLITSIRDSVFQGIKVFLPMFIIIKGGTIQSGGFSLFAVTIASTIAGIIGGKLADIFGDQPVLVGTISISPIFLLLGLHTSGIISLCALMLGFAFLEASSPVTTAMAQKRCPDSRSTVSSLAMGVSWGIANLFASPVGLSADIIGLEATLTIVALLPWIVTTGYLLKRLLVK